MINPHDPLYRSALIRELNRWGAWIEKNSDFEGYPSVNILIGFLMGRGGGTAGHKILCRDMPPHVYSIHRRVLRLSEDLQEAIWACYVTRIRADGTLWTFEARAQRLGLSEEALRMRVSRARTKLLELSDAEPCESVMTEAYSG